MRASLTAASILALALGACADNSPTDDPIDPADDDQVDEGPDETDETDPPSTEEVSRDYDELAQVIGAHVRAEFPIMLATAGISKNQVPEGFVLNGDGTGSGTVGGLNFLFTYWCNAGDAAHTVVPCDGTAHHSHIQVTMTGSNTIDSMAMDGIDRYVDWEIRDLTLDKARFRGPDNVKLATSVAGADGVTTAYSLNFDATYEKVRFMPAALIPTYGTIDFAINAERTRGDDHRVFVTNAQLVYGASGVPTTLTFDGSIAYTLDLDTGAVVRL